MIVLKLRAMDLYTVRDQLKKTLRERRMTQEAFARKHDLSSSWLNKFLREEVTDPRLSSLERLQRAIDAEALKVA
jgi:transcriptional regulator with XRE-family HTH domain